MPEDSKLLLVVHTSVEAGHDAAFNTWYHSHVPNEICHESGVVWGARYRETLDPRRYIALYGVGGGDHLDRILPEFDSDRPEILNRDFERRLSLKGISQSSVAAYVQTDGQPFDRVLMEGNRGVIVAYGPTREHASSRVEHTSQSFAAAGKDPGIVGQRLEFELWPHLLLRAEDLGVRTHAAIVTIDIPAPYEVWTPMPSGTTGLRPMQGVVGTPRREASQVEGDAVFRPISKHWPI